MNAEQRNKSFVLAIDPALSTTGYAVIDMNTLELECIDKFTTSPKHSDDYRINEIVVKLLSVAAQYPIKYIILEDGFLGSNARTCIQLATLRGAIIGTFSLCKYCVYHMLPSEIRKAFGCGGRAKKDEVAQAVINMYPNNDKLNNIGPYSDKQNKNKTSDIYDAISIGIAFIKNHRSIVDETKV